MQFHDDHGNFALTPLYAPITASAIGATAVVAAQTGKKIVVLGYALTANGANNIKFQSGATDLTGLLYANAAGWQQAIAAADVGLFRTAAGAALNINLSAALAVGGFVVYALQG